jgi:hypothetical protein
MPGAYHPHLRWRAVWQRLFFGLSFAAIASNLFISETLARRYYSYYLEGDLFPKEHRDRRFDAYLQFNQAEVDYILQIVADDPYATVEEYVERFQNETRRPMSVHVFMDALAQTKLTRKKITKYFIERDFDQRFEWCEQWRTEFLGRQRRLIFYDESVTDDRRYQQMYGRSLRGHRVFAHGVNFRGKRFSMHVFVFLHDIVLFVSPLEDFLCIAVFVVSTFVERMSLL